MKLLIAAIGSARQAPLGAIAADYAERAQRIASGIGLSGPAIRDGEANRALAGTQRMDAEAALLARFAEGAEIRVVLDENGVEMASATFAATLAEWRDGGRRSAAFLIGGADGHAASTLESATLRLSLGRATWPHLLARAMVSEQIYRAMTILSGRPYHRE